MKAHEVMALFRDVPGVAGSCLMDAGGTLLIRDVPPGVADDLLLSVGRRGRAALSAVQLPMPGSDQVVLRFERLTIFNTQVGDNLLIVLGDPTTQTSVVRTATRVSAPVLSAIREPQHMTQYPGATAHPAPGRRSRRRDEVWG